MSSKRSRSVFLIAAMAAVVCAVLVRVASVAQDASSRPRAAQRAAVDLSDEEFDALLSIVAERQPAMVERVRNLRETDPEQFKQAARRLLDHERFRPLLAMRRNDPAGFELHMVALRAKAQAGRLRRQLSEAGAD